MDQLAKNFPAGLKYTVIYNPTQFIQQSVNAVTETIGEAVILVVLVVILFLQTWRAAVIPLVAIPISLVGTFLVMAMFGFSLNNLSLFGLVLAIGIVVDDAIVVVENVERNIAAGLSPRDAARKSMDEVGSALVAIALVLCAVFVPSAFITGISGQFYQQFALTIAGATVISLIVSLTLSPAMCALLLKPHTTDHQPGQLVDPADPRLLPHLQRGLRQAGRRLRLVRGAHRAGGGGHAGRVRGDPGLRPQRVPQDAGRVHPTTGRRLPHRRDAAARRRVAGTHRRGQSPSRRHCLEDAGRRACGEHRRFLRCHVHQCAERGRRVLRARAVRGARRQSAKIRRRHPGRAVPEACRNPGSAGAGGATAACAWRRQCRRRAHDDPGPSGIAARASCRAPPTP